MLTNILIIIGLLFTIFYLQVFSLMMVYVNKFKNLIGVSFLISTGILLLTYYQTHSIWINNGLIRFIFYVFFSLFVLTITNICREKQNNQNK